MPAPSAVLFDNDGLLLDTESVWTRAESDLFERHGFEFAPDHKLELIGTNPRVAGGILERHLEQPGRGAELMVELDALVFAELEGGVEPMPGARELAAALREAGVPIAVVSNSPRAFIERALDIVGMSDQFGALVSGHEVPAPKPAADPYLEACARLGVPPTPEVVVLEDSPTGVEAGLAAGLTVIGVPSVAGIDLGRAHRIANSLADAELLSALTAP